MGKNQRHQKKLKSERAKTKLKTTKTKFLPKGQNITNTTFKIKPIVLLEQLPGHVNDEGCPIDIKGLLSRIKHYNDNIRHAASKELKQRYTSIPPDKRMLHLAEIMRTVCELIQDREAKVRNSCAELMNEIITYTSTDKLKSFFHLITSHLCCAMTHIDKNIQEDSLNLLGVLLDKLPNFFMEHFDKILTSFITLISRLRHDSGVARTLTVNLGSKMTSVRWRIKVLSQLLRMLKVIIPEETRNHSVQILSRKTKEFSVGSACLPIYKGCNDLEDCFSNCRNYLNGNQSHDNVLKKHASIVIPLLFETWMEVNSTNKSADTGNTLLNEEAAALLSCIVDILYRLQEYMLQHNSNAVDSAFLSEEGKCFLNYLLVNFPYYQNKPSKTKGKTQIMAINSDPRCAKENLLICYIFCKLYVRSIHTNYNIELLIIINYLTKEYKADNTYLNKSNVKYLIKIFQLILLDHFKIFKRSKVQLDAVLECAINLHRNKKIPVQDQEEIFQIIADISDNPYMSRLKVYHSWLRELPCLLLHSEISSTVVESLLLLSRKGNTHFQEALLETWPRISSNLNNIKFLPDTNNEMTIKKLVYILFYIPIIPKITMNNVHSYVKDNPTTTWTKYFLEMLQLRMQLVREAV